MGFASKFVTAGFAVAVALASCSTVLGEEMNTPLKFDVFSGSTGCDGEPTDQGTTTYLAPMPQLGSFCENSITAVDIGDEQGTMVDTAMYTKINIVSCDAYDTTGYVFMDVYLCYDSSCGNCEMVPIAGQLILPEYTPTPSVDECWSIASASAQVTTHQRFTSTANPSAVSTYWTIFAEHSCIGEKVDLKIEADLDANTPADAKQEPSSFATAPEAGGVRTSINAKTTATMMMLIAAAVAFV